VALGVFLYGASLITVGENPVGNFRKEQPVHAGMIVMQSHGFGGSNPFVIGIRASKRDQFLEPKEIQKLEDFNKFLLEKTPVDRILGYTDYLKVMQRAFYNEDQAYYRLPETREQAAQLMLINTDERLDEYVDADRSWVRLLVRMPDHRTSTALAFMDSVDAYLAKSFPASEGYTSYVSGDEPIYAVAATSIVRTVIRTLSVSAVFILLVLIVLFRSVRVGIFTLAPNAFPIVVQLGVMGFSGVQLCTGLSMVSAIAIGIAIDDTIHYVDEYRRGVAAHGDLERAAREAMLKKGPAMVFTSVIFALGFVIFAPAQFTQLGLMGIFLAISVVAALVGDIVWLPGLLMAFRLRLAVPKPALAAAGGAPASTAAKPAESFAKRD
jgi:hypothetical protein